MYSHTMPKHQIGVLQVSKGQNSRHPDIVLPYIISLYLDIRNGWNANDI